jgi:phosphate transport system ATP-binding protein
MPTTTTPATTSTAGTTRRADTTATALTRPAARIDIVHLTAYYGDLTAVADINLAIEPNQVTALIGPSGCGKSTVLRCVNALHQTVPGARAEGQILLDGVDVLARDVDRVRLRRRVGMIFQQPNPFPTMSIYDNVVAGIRLGRRRPRHDELDSVVERALVQTHLWPEVRDRLGAPGAGLSGGQQQRLCIARALAVDPEVILMDEPCSALDPISTLAIEELIAQLRHQYTIVIVTHNLQQAARVSDLTAFLTVDGPNQPGRLVEVGPTARLFAHPANAATERYLTGKIG